MAVFCQEHVRYLMEFLASFEACLRTLTTESSSTLVVPAALSRPTLLIERPLSSVFSTSYPDT
ncbi:MAG: hypothetical protein Q9180_009505, partial [Flavoplaca navasiana]